MQASSSIQDEAKDVDPVRHSSIQTSSGLVESAKEAGVVEASPPSSPGQQGFVNLPSNNGNAFPPDEV